MTIAGECQSRFSPSVVCTREAGHHGSHHDIENPRVSWMDNDVVQEAVRRQQGRWRAVLDRLAER